MFGIYFSFFYFYVFNYLYFLIFNKIININMKSCIDMEIGICSFKFKKILIIEENIHI